MAEVIRGWRGRCRRCGRTRDLTREGRCEVCHFRHHAESVGMSYDPVRNQFHLADGTVVNAEALENAVGVTPRQARAGIEAAERAIRDLSGAAGATFSPREDPEVVLRLSWRERLRRALWRACALTLTVLSLGTLRGWVRRRRPWSDD